MAFFENDTAKVKRENADLKDQVAGLLAKIQFIVDRVTYLEGEETFTFPDGDMWYRKWR